MANGLKGIEVDVIHIVLKGVPRGSEGTLLTIRIIRDNVDTRNLRHTIHRQMIVSNSHTLSRWEETAKANSLSCTPHTIDNTTSILERELFLIELRSLTTNHIEQNAITSLIAIDMRIGSPILSTQSPSIATVLSIEADEINSE